MPEALQKKKTEYGVSGRCCGCTPPANLIEIQCRHHLLLTLTLKRSLRHSAANYHSVYWTNLTSLQVL